MNAAVNPQHNTKITGSRYIAETLAAYGLDHVFFMDAVLRRTLAECARPRCMEAIAVDDVWRALDDPA